MILFDLALLDALGPAIVGKCIESVVIGTSSLTFSVADISLQCEELVNARIGGKVHKWEPGPNDAPWGLLVAQTVVGIKLIEQDCLCICLESGDEVHLHTAESQYESVIIRYPSPPNSLVMDVY